MIIKDNQVLTTDVWFVAEEAFENRQESVVKTLKELGQEVIGFKFDIVNRSYLPITTEELGSFNYILRGEIDYDKIIIYGPIIFINKIKRAVDVFNKMRNISNPVYAYGFENVNCMDYYWRQPLDWFLNSDISFVPYGLFKQRMQTYFSSVVMDFPVFVRPNSSKKPFTGFVIDKDNYERELKFLEENINVYDDEIVGYCAAKEIKSEWRFWIVDGKVVGDSPYSWDDVDGSNVYFENDRIKLLPLAEQIAKTWFIDDAFTVDLCIYKDQPKVVEINSFCSAGFYRANVKEILKKVIELKM